MKIPLASLSLIPFVLAAAAAGASAQGLPAELRRCMAETDDGRRLACFDREAASLAGAAAPAATGIAGAAPALTPEQRFGLRGEVARETLEREKAATPVADRLQAKVVAVAVGATGDWVVTLDNGQVWAQVPTGTRYRIRVGDAVEITPGALGSYMLTGESGRAVRVRRRR